MSKKDPKKTRQTKRGHGEGSVRYDEKRMRWVGKIMLGYRPDGKPNRKTVYGNSRKEVLSRLAELRSHYHAGSLPSSAKITIGEYLVGDVGAFLAGEDPGGWLGRHKLLGAHGSGLRPNTYMQYRNAIKCYILSPEHGIGNILLQKLTPDHCENLYASILSQGRSVRTAQVTHQVLRTALQAAVDKGLLAFNPADRVSHKPRVKYRAENRPRLAWEDAPKILGRLCGTKWYLPFLLAMSAGLRRGEALGLRWPCVDLSRGILRIQEQLGYDEKGKLALAPVKTESSIRDIPIPEDVRQVLEAKHRVAPDPEGFVCVNENGEPLHPRYWNRVWAKLRKDLKLPKEMHPHDLRGSWITWLALRKVDLKATSKMAGHSDVRVTLDLYQSVIREMTEEAARAMVGLAKAASSSETEAHG